MSHRVILSALCEHCLQPLAWSARAEVHVHADTMIRQCDPDRASGTTATPSAIHGTKPTVDVVEAMRVPGYTSR